MKNAIVTELKNRGIDVTLEPVTILKNKIECKGFRVIKEGALINPVIYTKPEDTVSEIADFIIELLKENAPQVDPKQLMDPEFFKSHIQLAVSKRDGEDDDVVTRPYLNFDQFMRTAITPDLNVKVTDLMLATCGIPEEEAFEIAKANSESTASIRNMAEALSEAGFPVEEGESPIWVGICNGNRDGACVLTMPNLFQNFCEERKLDGCYILPSSTQEVVILPKENWNVDQVPTLLSMVDDINNAEVDPKLQMDPAVYEYSCVDNAIKLLTKMEETERSKEWE